MPIYRLSIIFFDIIAHPYITGAGAGDAAVWRIEPSAVSGMSPHFYKQHWINFFNYARTMVMAAGRFAMERARMAVGLHRSPQIDPALHDSNVQCVSGELSR